MRLGATITSERGKPVTKTGNEYLEIIITNERGEQELRLDITRDEDGFIADVLDYSTGEVVRVKENGSPKHGKTCAVCGQASDDIDVKGLCHDCAIF